MQLCGSEWRHFNLKPGLDVIAGFFPVWNQFEPFYSSLYDLDGKPSLTTIALPW